MLSTFNKMMFKIVWRVLRKKTIIQKKSIFFKLQTWKTTYTIKNIFFPFVTFISVGFFKNVRIWNWNWRLTIWISSKCCSLKFICVPKFSRTDQEAEVDKRRKTKPGLQRSTFSCFCSFNSFGQCRVLSETLVLQWGPCSDFPTLPHDFLNTWYTPSSCYDTPGQLPGF